MSAPLARQAPPPDDTATAIALVHAEVHNTGDGEVRIGAHVIPREVAITLAVRLLDCAHVAAFELNPERSAEVHQHRVALARLDAAFKGAPAVLCQVQGEPTKRRLPALRLDHRRAMVRVGMLCTALLLRRAGKPWRGFMLLHRGELVEHDPGFRHVWANGPQLEALPAPRQLEVRHGR